MTSVPSKFIIVADDHEGVAEMLATLVELSSNHTAAFALNGQQAVDLGRQRRPDVCVLDIEMPVMDGIEAARQLHATFGEGRPVIIGMSGRQWVQADESGLFELFLTKPLTVEAILDFIDPPPRESM